METEYAMLTKKHPSHKMRRFRFHEKFIGAHFQSIAFFTYHNTKQGYTLISEYNQYEHH
jgi:hypothetical protein